MIENNFYFPFARGVRGGYYLGAAWEVLAIGLTSPEALDVLRFWYVPRCAFENVSSFSHPLLDRVGPGVEGILFM